MKKAFIRSVTVIIIFALSIAIGYYSSLLWDKAEKNLYPLRYAEFVDDASESFGVPKKIIYAVIKTESDFDSTAQSSAGAIGLMQIAPATFEEISGKLGDSYEKGMMYDPETNIRYGTYYLSYLYRYFEDWDLVFAAYNAGMGNVSSWLDDTQYSDGQGHLVNIPFAETSQYVKKINDAINKYIDLYGDEF
ncbi:MAG: lytic transglycosylase domain-containing protein [Clostridia bacterium]|nr:lytic transglycosylase domain-containing protein [Clostridia bacterium]